MMLHLPFGTPYTRDLESPFLAVLKFLLKTFLLDMAFSTTNLTADSVSQVTILQRFESLIINLQKNAPRLSVSLYFHS